MTEKTNWYTVYTKPRWEKKVHRLMEEQGIQSYCPLNKVRRRWSDRYKVVDEPLFTSYVFVRVPENTMEQVRRIHGVLNFVYWNGKPAIVKNEEIDIIKLFLREHEQVEVERLEYLPNQRVRITSGVLMDEEAIVIQPGRNKAQVILQNLGYKLIAKIDTASLRPV